MNLTISYTSEQQIVKKTATTGRSWYACERPWGGSCRVHTIKNKNAFLTPYYAEHNRYEASNTGNFLIWRSNMRNYVAKYSKHVNVGHFHRDKTKYRRENAKYEIDEQLYWGADHTDGSGVRKQSVPRDSRDSSGKI